jgi:hypothetical protein
MKQIILIFFLTLFSFVCKAQTYTIIKKDSSKFILNPFNFYLFKDAKNNSISLPNYIFDMRKISPQFDLFHDSLYIRQVFYDDLFYTGDKRYFVYNLHHYVNDPLRPYGNYKSALFLGTLNYLILLFDKEK